MSQKFKRISDYRWVESRPERQPMVIDVCVEGPVTKQGVRDLNSMGSPLASSVADARHLQEVGNLLCDHRFECYGHTDVCEFCATSVECEHKHVDQDREAPRDRRIYRRPHRVEAG
jgi:hypothetical protein